MTAHYDRFLCQLTCQSADIMSWLCGVGVRVRFRVTIFFSKTTSARDMQFFLNERLPTEDEKLFKALRSIRPSVCYNQKCENFYPFSLLLQCRDLQQKCVPFGWLQTTVYLYDLRSGCIIATNTPSLCSFLFQILCNNDILICQICVAE